MADLQVLAQANQDKVARWDDEFKPRDTHVKLRKQRIVKETNAASDVRAAQTSPVATFVIFTLSVGQQ